MLQNIGAIVWVLSVVFGALIAIRYSFSESAEPEFKQETVNSDYVVLLNYINSCNRGRQLIVANRLVDLYRIRHAGKENMNANAERLCCAIQLKRIQLKINSPLNA